MKHLFKLFDQNLPIIFVLALTISVVLFFQGRSDDKRRAVPQLPEAPTVNLKQLQKVP
jgi:hypothetical protein